MKVRLLTGVFAGMLIAGATAPAAWAENVDLGGTADVDVVDIEIEHHWTVGELKPSADVIAYRTAGTLWEATADTTLDNGGIPLVSGFSARSGDVSYPALWTVATPLGIPPTALPPGGSATGKIYFDVTGGAPTAVAYTLNGVDAVVWEEHHPPVAVTASRDRELCEDPSVSTGTADPQIELRRVRKVFGDPGNPVVAVDDVDLSVGSGELFAILGPSGSGKTTVLRMIAGFEKPTAGTVHLGGSDVTVLPAAKRDANTVFQDYALFPHMTVTQNVEYGLLVKGVPKAERRQRAGAALEMVRLAEHATRKPAQLSGGQQQRVALARALVGRPKVLLLDEPLGALDLKLREQMQVELKAIQRELGITFVIVTHDQDEALTLSDRLAVFNNGRIEQVGAGREVYENPVNRFVADFVGTSNVLDGDTARALLGRAGTYAIRPERMVLLDAGDAVPAGMRSVPARVAEVVYAGPVTRVAADTDSGQRLTATLVSARTAADLTHDAPVVLAWHDDSVRPLTRGAP